MAYTRPYPNEPKLGRPPFTARELYKIADNLALMPQVIEAAKKYVADCEAWKAEQREATAKPADDGSAVYEAQKAKFNATGDA